MAYPVPAGAATKLAELCQTVPVPTLREIKHRILSRAGPPVNRSLANKLQSKRITPQFFLAGFIHKSHPIVQSNTLPFTRTSLQASSLARTIANFAPLTCSVNSANFSLILYIVNGKALT